MSVEAQTGTSPVSNRDLHRRLDRLSEEMTQLAGAPLPLAEFQAEFLKRVVDFLHARAAAFWRCHPDGALQLQYQINLPSVELERSPEVSARHEALLRQAGQQAKPIQQPPQSGAELAAVNGEGPANLTAFRLLVAPIVVEDRVEGLLEVFIGGEREAGAFSAHLPVVIRMAGMAAVFLRQHRVREVLNQQQLWNDVENYSRQIHASLDPKQVAYLVVNEGRRLLDCDRVSVAVRWGRRAAVEAISGADVVEKRSRLVRYMRTLFDRVLAWGERLVYTGAADPSLPPAVLRALNDYLAESHSKVLILQPLRDEREKDTKRPPRSAILIESFEPGEGVEQLLARLDIVSRNTASALYNAVEHRRIPLRWLWRPLAGVRDGLNNNGWIRWLIVASVLGGVAAALVLIPYPWRLEAKGQLLPRDRQTVQATLKGTIVNSRVQSGDRVNRNDELLTLEDIDYRKAVEQLRIQIGTYEDHITAVKKRLGEMIASEERFTLREKQIGYEYELQKARGELNLLLEQARDPRRMVIRAPISGTVITFDVQERLVGAHVKPGDSLLRIVKLDGPWEVELQIPVGHVGRIKEALQRAGGKPLQVDLLVASLPNRTFTGYLTLEGLGGEARTADDAVTLPARVELADRSLIELLGGTPVGVEVRAKIHCGERSIGYVWFHEVWEFVYEHLLF